MKNLQGPNIILTSDFPSTINHEVVARILATANDPRVAWVAPLSSKGTARFAAAQSIFRKFGVENLECYDLATQANAGHYDSLARYDVVYLTGGDPVQFRDNIRRTGFDEHLNRFLAQGGLVIGASGGAMQLTKNLSLFRLASLPLDAVIAQRAEFDGLGVVELEMLPHLNRHDDVFLLKVQKYSESIDHEVLALHDGAALVFRESDWTSYGKGVRFTGGAQYPVVSITPRVGTRR